jgi:hypothetical protein
VHGSEKTPATVARKPSRDRSGPTGG